MMQTTTIIEMYFMILVVMIDLSNLGGTEDVNLDIPCSTGTYTSHCRIIIKHGLKLSK